MARKLLYYPSMNIPNDKWLRSSLLYADKLSSIFPFDNLNHSRVSDEMRLLHDHGQYEPFVSYEVLPKLMGTPKIKSLEEKFMHRVRSDIFQNLKEKIKDADFQAADLNWYDTYTHKLTPNIRDFLKELGLMQEGFPRLRVERSSALLYMGLLAQLLASEIDKKNLTTPSTDFPEYEQLLFDATDKERIGFRFQLINCLPVPRQDVPLKKIIDFKQQRRYELLQFRRELDDFGNKLSKAENIEEAKLIMTQFEEKIEVEIEKIRKVLKASTIGLASESFSSLLDFKNPAIITTLAGAGTAGVIFSNPFVGLGVGAVGLTLAFISSYNMLQDKVTSSPYSCLFHVKNELI